MNKFMIPLTLVAAATLAACGSQEVRRSNTPEAFVSPVPSAELRMGKGKIVELLDPTGPVDAISWQRMTLAMEDGSRQVVDRKGHQVAWGEHVTVRADNTLKRDPYFAQAKP